MKTKAELPDCPVATTVSLIGSKWKLLILRNLLVRPWRFNELRNMIFAFPTQTYMLISTLIPLLQPIQ